jgi:glycosyltransferase involved in cell wall biosynthesis
VISAAMMVKNEESNLRRCLESIKSFVQEIVIVDTGSTDKTVEIAKEYTDKIYHEPWRNDFGWHRNHSFGLCTQDWIFVIDADEELIFQPPMTTKRLVELLGNAESNINSVGMEVEDFRASRGNVAARLDSLRIFRRDKVKWRRKVHNTPVIEGDSALMKGAFIRHHGYDLSPAQNQAKAERTIGLLKECIEENPEDYESVFYIAQAYGAFLQDEDNALLWGKRYVKMKAAAGKEFNPSIYHLNAAICGKKGLEKDCRSWIDQGLKDDPLDIDLLMDLIQWSIRNEDRTTLVAASQRFTYCYENFDKYRFDHPGRFFFNYNANALASALFYATTGLIENGVVMLRKLKGTIPALNEKNRTEILMKLQNIMNQAQLVDIGGAEVKPPNPQNQVQNAVQQPPPQQMQFPVRQHLELPAI